MTAKNKIKIAVTGGIGSGKSTISEYIAAKYGYFFIDADKIGHQILFHEEIIFKLKELFGETIFSNGKPDRKKIAAEVFQNNSQIEAFNNIMHPAILEEIKSEAAKHEKILVEAALLFEAGWEKAFDASILVTCSEKIRIERVIKRDNRSIEEITAIIKRQIKNEKATAKTKYIINNSSDIDSAIIQTEKTIKEIEKRFSYET